MYDNEHEFENGIERSILKDMIAYQKSYRPNFDDWRAVFMKTSGTR